MTATYLSICQDAIEEAGTGERGQMVDVAAVGPPYGSMAGWVRRAWRSIQTARDDWFFARRTFEKDLDATMGARFAPADLVGPAGIRRWLLKGVRSPARAEWIIADTTAGQGADGGLVWVPWSEFRPRFVFTPPSPGRPLYFTVEPDQSIRIAPPMREGSTYRLTGDYVAPVQDLRENGDVPEGLPDAHTEVVMWKAVTYALQHLSGDPDQRVQAQAEYDRAIGTLLLEQTPEVGFAPPSV